ncbi:helix-turn-helix domain-containing protein [Desulfonema ishimotonii]|uniref:helix-turn-helix domain-containing protein n=1 Tax=Desulfonema ishimotonii TaxID=45657 RepID=UPI000F574B28
MELLIRKSFKYRIYPTGAQISNLENQFSMCRHLYNRNGLMHIKKTVRQFLTISSRTACRI